MIRRTVLVGILSISLPASSAAAQQDVGSVVVPGEIPAVERGPLTYRIVATDARLNRRAMGPVLREVHGVPAEPVDSFTWDGVGSVPIEGEFVMVLEPVTETGFVRARWTDENGEWEYQQQEFIHPEHLSGVRIGSSVNEIDGKLNNGVVTNVYLHGDTGAGQPVMPTVFAYAAAWGPALVARNGDLFPNPFELPAPAWLGHVMVTEGTRDSDGRIMALDGEPYNPSKATFGRVEPLDLEVHLVWHDERFPRNSSIPPIFDFFYHLVFETVNISVIEGAVEDPFDSIDR